MSVPSEPLLFMSTDSQCLFQMPSFWTPNELIVNGKKEQFPLPEHKFKFNFVRSEGMVYQAQAVRQS